MPHRLNRNKAYKHRELTRKNKLLQKKDKQRKDGGCFKLFPVTSSAGCKCN